MTLRFARPAVCAVLLAAGALVLAGCAGTTPAPRMPSPPPAPLAVDGDQLPAIAFPKVRLDIPDYRAIGYHHVGTEYIRDYEYRWGPHFRDETDKLNTSGQALLAQAGYRVAADATDALQLIGTIREFRYDSYANKEAFEQADFKVAWELHKPGDERPYFVMQTGGAGRIAAGETGGIRIAFEEALGHLLASSEFAAAVRAGANP